jgi:hypothetical protein
MKSSNKRVENLCCKKVGNSEIKVFAENQTTDNPLIRKTEFIFEIDSSTKKQTEFPIFDLYKIMSIVYHALNDYVEKKIMNELKSLSSFQIMIEAEGNNEKEIQMKDNLYNYHLNRLAQKYTEMYDDVCCQHIKNNLSHFLVFSRI